MNIWIVLAAAVSSFIVGGLWYSPMLFGNAWTRENGSQATSGHPATVFGVAFAFSLLAAAAFAVLVGPSPTLEASLKLGALAGVGLVAASYGINYQFAQRSFKLWLIDGGYHAVQFLLFGVVFGLWG